MDAASEVPAGITFGRFLLLPHRREPLAEHQSLSWIAFLGDSPGYCAWRLAPGLPLLAEGFVVAGVLGVLCATNAWFGMTALGVRREKAALSSGCKAHPAIRSRRKHRSRHGGDEMSEAFG